MSEAPGREVEILNAALDLSGAARAAYLERVCADTPELRQRVEELILAHEQADTFLQEPGIEMRGAWLTGQAAPAQRERIGRYRLLEKIGEGGCGIVYLAEQEQPVRRRVALKLIKLGMDTRQVIARFEAERQALAMMDHPNIAKVLDGGATETGRPYFVMELVRGVKMTDFCAQHGLSGRERLELFITVCQAVQHAHQKGIIHRDLKPSNILVSMDNGVPTPKVIDFGIAKATQGRLTDLTLFTAFEQFLGTPAYMSPEQAVMTSLDIDTRTDIYSLGVLLYELLTGQTPFDTRQLMAAGLEEMLRTIREVAPARPSTRLTQARQSGSGGRALGGPGARGRMALSRIEPDLDWIVMKCLEKDRARRYETANGLAADVRRFLGCEPVLARPPSRWDEFQKTVRRHKIGFGATGAVMVALCLGLVASLWQAGRVSRAEQQARAQLWESLKSQAEARRYSRRTGQRTDSLAALAAAAEIERNAELRDAAIAALALPDLRLSPIGVVVGTNDAAVVFDADYRRYARIGRGGSIRIHSRTQVENRGKTQGPENSIASAAKRSENGRHRVEPAEGGSEIHRLETGAEFTPMLWGRGALFSPDGRYLAALDRAYEWGIWRLSDGIKVVSTPSGGCSALSFSGDSMRVAIGKPESIQIFDLATGLPRSRWPVECRPNSLAFAPDNRRLAMGRAHFGRTSDLVTVYDLEDGRVLNELPVGASVDKAVAWHPSGRYLAASRAQYIEVWDVTAGARVAVLQGHAQEVTSISFDPSGAFLLSDSWDGTPRLWHPAPAREYLKFHSGMNNFRFSPDGRWAGAMRSQNGEIQMLEFLPSQEFHTFMGSLGDSLHSFHFGDISRDGRLLALGSPAGVSLRELPGGRELARFSDNRSGWVAFHPSGNELLLCGGKGFEMWPILEDGLPGKLRIGPARSLALPFAADDFAMDRHGGILVIASQKAGQVRMVDSRTGAVREAGLPHRNVSYVALSPDAAWLATSGWHSDQLQIWNMKTLSRCLNLVGERVRAFFTPDGKQLVVARSESFTFHTVPTWEVRHRVDREVGMAPGWVAFSGDGSLMALETSPGLIQLMETGSGRRLAGLQNPHGDISRWMGFTPDGTELITAAPADKAIHRWDLSTIRARLKALRLDWDYPDFPERERIACPPLQIEVQADPVGARNLDH